MNLHVIPLHLSSCASILFLTHCITLLFQESELVIICIIIVVGGTKGAAAEVLSFHPVVVKGEKAVEAALMEGNHMVVNKDIDVFAIASEKGINIHV